MIISTFEEVYVFKSEIIDYPQEYPDGTTLHRFTVYDKQNRYLPVPWNRENRWIETFPICIDVYATDDNLAERLSYFKDKKCIYQKRIRDKKQ